MMPHAEADRIRLLDRAEKYAFAALFVWLGWRLLGDWAEHRSHVALIYLFDQACILAFLLLRRPPIQLSLRVRDWSVGVAGTVLPLLIQPSSGLPSASAEVIVGLMLAGTFIHLWAKLSLRRSFGIVAANRGIQVVGPYRLVRHPMYLGYMLSQAGFLLSGPTAWNAALIAALWLLYVGRIVAEEGVLIEDAAYRSLCERTRFRLVPGVY